jgi:hypothetical protein
MEEYGVKPRGGHAAIRGWTQIFRSTLNPQPSTFAKSGTPGSTPINRERVYRSGERIKPKPDLTTKKQRNKVFFFFVSLVALLFVRSPSITALVPTA